MTHRHAFLLAFALGACTPTAPATTSAPPPPDPLSATYEVHIGAAVLPNVQSVAVAGPDLELIEVRIGGTAPRLTPGRVGYAKLVVTTNWTPGDRTMESWRAALTGLAAPSQVDQPAQPVARQDVIVAATVQGATGTYTFRRCLPDGHEMALGAQDARVTETWRITCETVERS
ncbi:MAG: hypothetical protein ABUS48_05580 [Pseudomonadota bacterium]